MTRVATSAAPLLALLLCAVAGACATGEARDGGEAGELPVAWTVADTPSMRAGAAETDALSAVSGAVHLPGGGVAVANSGFHRIDMFDASGTLVRRMGREGQGPGEFTYPAWIGLRGDTLRVWDMVQGRLTLFDTTGALIRTEQPVRDLGSFLRVAGQFADGSLLLVGAETPAWRKGAFRDSVLLVRVDMAAGTRDTLARVPGDEQFGSRSADGRGFEESTLPFGRRLAVATNGDRVYVGTGDTSAILSSADGGRWTAAASIPGPPRRVTRQDIDDHWERLITVGARANSGPTRAEGMQYPGEYPPYTSLVPADNGDLWVGIPSRPSQWTEAAQWMVFAPDGALRGTVRVPGRSRLLQVGDGWILAVDTDENDQETIVRYPLAAPRR